MGSPGTGESEHSLLIFGSVKVEKLRARMSKKEEKPSRVSCSGAASLASPCLSGFQGRTQGPDLSGDTEEMATDNHSQESRF